jgi:pimeloyl-ACP methyl ester carboxylesterase
MARTSAIVLTLLLLAPGCGGEEPPTEPPAGSRSVSFTSADGVELEGRIVGEGSVGIVLSHMRPSDQASWWGFAEDLADEGYLVLTYNFRGYCPDGAAGCSSGETDIPAIWQDVLGAIDLIRSEGAQRVMLIGASMGGTASLLAAAEEGSGVDAVVTLSAPISFEGLSVGPDVLTRVSAAKLFIAGVGDGSAGESAQQLYALSPPPKRLEILTTDDHGTDILDGNQSGRARTMILNYLERYRDA